MRMKTTTKRYSAGFKAKVTLEDLALAELDAKPRDLPHDDRGAEAPGNRGMLVRFLDAGEAAIITSDAAGGEWITSA